MYKYFFWLLELCLSVHPFTCGYGTFWPLTQVHCCTECDIRSCLNTLQFLNRKKQSLKTVCTLLFCVQPCSIFWKHFATSLAVHNLTVINVWVLLVGGLAKPLLWDLVFAGGCGLTGDWSERHDKQHFWHLGRGQHHGLQCFQTACCYAMCKNLGCIPFVHLKLLRERHWYLSCWRYFKGKRRAKELWFRG